MIGARAPMRATVRRATGRTNAAPGRSSSAGPGALAGLVALAAPAWVVLLRAALPALLGTPVAPDALSLATAATAWTAPRAAVPFALVAGLLADAAGEAPWGAGAARLAILASLFGGARAASALELPGLGLVFVGLFVLAERLCDALLVAALSGAAAGPLCQQAVWVAGLTALAAPIGLSVARTLLGAPDGASPGRPAPRATARTPRFNGGRR